MAQKITDLTELTSGNVALTDMMPIVDISASATKKVLVSSIKTAVAPCLVYRAKITQASTNAPVEATVFENTTGQTLTSGWTYGDVGIWQLAGTFSTTKTFIHLSSGTSTRAISFVLATDSLTVRCYNLTVDPVALIDNATFYLEISIYA